MRGRILYCVQKNVVKWEVVVKNIVCYFTRYLQADYIGLAMLFQSEGRSGGWSVHGALGRGACWEILVGVYQIKRHGKGP